jgi:integrase
MVAMVAATGPRKSEALGLLWEDLDLTQGTAHIRCQLSLAKKGRPAKRVPLKTGAGERIIYLVPELVSVLKAHKADRFAIGHAGSTDYVFGTKDGHPHSQRNADRALRAAGDRAGLNPEGMQLVSWHDLRHTAISRLIAAGWTL